MKRAIFILGMHRSGTSVLARVVNLLGVDLGKNLMKPAKDNQKGFFEHEPIVQIHEQLLTDLGLNWSDSTPLPNGWESSPAAKKAQKALDKIIRQDFGKSEIWALKDPRQCRLMPLWLPLLDKHKIAPHFIVAYREPAEVAASLAKRDDMDEAAALQTWLSYSAEALLSAIDYPHTIVSYNDLMQNWQSTMTRAGKELAIDWAISIKEAAKDIDAFISKDLRHHKIGKHAYPKMVEACLKQLKKPQRKSLEKLISDASAQAQPYADSLRQARLSVSSLQHELELTAKKAARAKHAEKDLRQQFSALEEQYKSLQLSAEQYTAQLNQVYESASWKITGPLRKAKKLVKQASSE